MTVWTAGQARRSTWREDLGALAYHYHRLACLILTGTDPHQR